jgi:DNA-directed RNA polymerase subunit D
MDIEIVELMETKVRFILSDARPDLANALRRVLISDIPKMAIERVEFHLGPILVDGKEYESITPVFDEIIAHRLGLVPVPTDLELFTYRDECECGGEGCPSCSIMYSLNKIGPCTVYSGDMEPLGNPDLRVKDELVPIVKLNEGQAVLIYAIAELGTTRRHAKWQVTNGVGYKYLPKVTLDPSRCEDCRKCVRICPRDVFGIVDDKVVVANEIECILCKSCVETCETGAVEVDCDPTSFLFTFETDGSLSAKDTLVAALDILEAQFEMFREMVSDLD